jgi:hypothetical protein
MLKRFFTITSMCLGGLAVWVAAPALSLGEYAPDPVDFEQAVPLLHSPSELPSPSAVRAAAAPKTYNTDRDEGPVRWVSAPIKAPTVFDLVGLEDTKDPVEYRTRREGEAWTDWYEAHPDDPAWAGHSTYVQIRGRGSSAHGRLHYVNVSGTDSAAHGVLAGVRGAIHTAFVSAVATPLADASASKPSMVSRARWDPNNSCKPRRKASYGKVKAAVVHHTVNTNSYTASESKGIVLAICRFHRNSNGWDDIGYNALADRFGKLFVGRDGGIDKPVIGAQVQGFNAQTTGIASIGDHRTVKMPGVETNAIEKFIAWKLFTITHVNPSSKTTLTSAGGSLNRYPSGEKIRVYRVTYHSKLGKTECPGAAGRAQVVSIREGAQARI